MDLSNLLKCRICFKKYDQQTTNAYQLDCQHIFCGKCLKKTVRDTRSSASVYSMSIDEYVKSKGKYFMVCALCNHETYFNNFSEIKKCLLITQLLDMEKPSSKSRTSSAISCASRMSINEAVFGNSVDENLSLDESTLKEACSRYYESKAFDTSCDVRSRTDSINDISFVFEKYAKKETYFQGLFENMDKDKDKFVKVADIKRVLANDFQYEKYAEHDDHSTIHNEMELLKDEDLVNFETFVKIFMYVLKSELKLKSQDMLELLIKKSTGTIGASKQSSKDKYSRHVMRRRSFSSAFNTPSYKETLPDVVEL